MEQMEQMEQSLTDQNQTNPVEPQAPKPKPVHFSKVQLAFLHAWGRRMSYCADRGGGKTFVSSHKAILAAMERPYMRRGLVISPSHAKSLEAMGQIIRQADDKGLNVEVDRPSLMIILNKYSFITFRHTIHDGELEGIMPRWVWVEDADQMKRELYDKACDYLSNFEVVEKKSCATHLWATFCPRTKSHWTYREFGYCSTCDEDADICPCSEEVGRRLFSERQITELMTKKKFQRLIGLE